MSSYSSQSENQEHKRGSFRGDLIIPGPSLTVKGYYLYPPPVLRVVITGDLFDPLEHKLEASADLVCPKTVDSINDLFDGVPDDKLDDVRKAPAISPHTEKVSFPIHLDLRQKESHVPCAHHSMSCEARGW
jgi:hypothetical protein